MTIATCLRRVLFVAAMSGAVAIPAVPAVAGGGGCHSAAPTEGSGTTVAMSQMCMTPTILRVEPGTTVTWVNKDPMAHNLFGTGWAGGDLPTEGARVSHTFDAPGTYPYACMLHPGMTGAIVVGEAVPAAAVRPEDSGSDAAAPIVIGLLAVVLLGGTFAAGTWFGRGRVTSAT